MATNSRYSHKDETHSELFDCDSEPSISTKSANITQIRSLHPKIVNQIFGTWVTLSVGHVCHSPQHASSPVYVSDSGASMLCKTSKGGRCTGFHLFPCSTSHSELRTTQEGELILIAPGGRCNRGSHIYCVCVWTTLHHSVSLGLTVKTRVCLGWQVVPSAHLRLS